MYKILIPKQAPSTGTKYKFLISDVRDFIIDYVGKNKTTKVDGKTKIQWREESYKGWTLCKKKKDDPHGFHSIISAIYVADEGVYASVLLKFSDQLNYWYSDENFRKYSL